MFDRTQQVIDDLSDAEWFGSVGKQIDDGSIARYYSWDAAISESLAEVWVETRNAARNSMMDAISFELEALNSESPRAVNKVVEKIHIQTLPLVDRKLAILAEMKDLPDRFVSSVKWDITAIATAVEYSDVFVSSFYMNIRDWYLKGHFPCGWEGTYPRGRMIVF